MLDFVLTVNNIRPSGSLSASDVIILIIYARSFKSFIYIISCIRFCVSTKKMMDLSLYILVN